MKILDHDMHSQQLEVSFDYYESIIIGREDEINFNVYLENFKRNSLPEYLTGDITALISREMALSIDKEILKNLMDDAANRIGEQLNYDINNIDVNLGSNVAHVNICVTPRQQLQYITCNFHIEP